MSEGFFDVRVRATRYSSKFQTAPGCAKGWQSVLGGAYQKTHAVCLCPGSGERKLAIRHREPGGYYLARFPSTGHEHAITCRFHAPHQECSGLQGYAPGVIEELDDDTWRIRLARGLRSRSATAEGSAPNPATGSSSGRGRPAVTLLGLLHHLWSAARLDHWYPSMDGKRDADRVHYWLKRVASKTRISRMMLDDVLLVQAAKGSAASARNQAVVAQAIEHDTSVVLVSELSAFLPEWDAEAPKTLPVMYAFGMPHLNMAPETWVELQQRHVRQWAAWRRGERVMVIAQMSVRQGKVKSQALVLDIALMHVSPRWIPLDSSYEGLVEQRLYDLEQIVRLIEEVAAERAEFEGGDE